MLHSLRSKVWFSVLDTPHACGLCKEEVIKYQINQGASKNKVINTLMPRSLFRLKCIHGTQVADGCHEIST